MWRGVVLGLLATGAGLGVAELVASMNRLWASPVVPVAEEFIDWTPKWLRDWAIDTFGTSDKAVLVAGALMTIAAIGMIIGVLMVRGARVAAFALTIAVGFIGAFAVLIRPEPTLGRLLPSIVGTVVSLGVLWYLGPKPAGVDEQGRPLMMGPDRREFIQGAVGIGSVALIAGGLGRALRQRFEIDSERAALDLPEPQSVAPGLPADAELGVNGVTPFVVSNANFYRIDTALVVPQVSKDSWKLNISGLVDNELEFTFDDILARPQIERYITLSCVSNQVGGSLVGNALWQGVRLRDLLVEAGVQDEAEQVVSRSIDGWTCGSPIETIMDGRDAMLAVAMNGEPLPASHGYPARLVVPGLYGYVSATKWVTDIRLTRWEDFDGYWIPRGWSKLGPVKTMARIDTPRNNRRQDPGEIAFGGVAWAVHRGVSQVQVRIDGGEWLDADLGGVPSNDTWVQWVYRWQDVPEGEYTVEARAIDGMGEPQPSEPKPVAPDGAQGYHKVTVKVRER